jgi:A/G-specific adenine glycosylase
MILDHSIDPAQFQKAVLRWYDKHGRKDLPWQQNISPYRVWVSEIMLQQTQVTTFIPYFLRFMEHFPTVADLAQAPLDTVLHLWSGLGYYARARHLHKTANIIYHDFASEFPADVAALTELPGIGLSTAGAIASLSMQVHAAILDGNVKRVLARVYAVPEWPGKPAVTEQLWEASTLLTPKQRVNHYNQAMMDLGATLCVRGKPQCDRCPLTDFCVAYAEGSTSHYPVSKPRKQIPTRHTHVLVLLNPRNEILLVKRPPSGIWGGLWSLPECPAPAKLRTWCKQQFSCSAQNTQALENIEHTFSHFHLVMTPMQVKLEKQTLRTMEADQQLWYNPDNIPNIGLPAPIQRFLERVYDTSSILS